MEEEGEGPTHSDEMILWYRCLRRHTDHATLQTDYNEDVGAGTRLSQCQTQCHDTQLSWPHSVLVLPVQKWGQAVAVGYAVVLFSIIWICRCMVVSQFSTLHMVKTVELHIFLYNCISCRCDNLIPAPTPWYLETYLSSALWDKLDEMNLWWRCLLGHTDHATLSKQILLVWPSLTRYSF